jgi:hypothetical protein
MGGLLDDLCRTFGPATRIAATVTGVYAYRQLKREEKRIASGWAYEPGCFYEKNAAAMELEDPACAARSIATCRCAPAPATVKTVHVYY